MAFAVVIVRGAMGPPPDHTGERSLLFRWHYWRASARIAPESVPSALVGIGPSRFQDSYSRLKDPINPEDVRSAHNVFIDLIVDLGVGGWLLAALLMSWLVRAARGSAEDDSPTLDAAPQPATKERGVLEIETIDLVKVMLVAGLVFGTELVVRFAGIPTSELFLLWSLGPIGFLFVASVLTARDWLDERAMRLGLVAAAALLLVHNQIEMTFFQPNSAPIAWVIIALAAARTGGTGGTGGTAEPAPARPMPRWFAFASVVMLLIVAGDLALNRAAPLMREQRLLAQASRFLRKDPHSLPALDMTLNLLREARQEYPADPRPYEWEVRLAMEAAEGIHAKLRSAQTPDVKARGAFLVRQYLDRALATLKQAEDAGLGSTSMTRQKARTLLAEGIMLGNPDRLREGFAAFDEVLKAAPHAWSNRRELGDLYWRLDQRDKAREEYRQALRLSGLSYLDPLRQMGDKERARIEARIKE